MSDHTPITLDEQIEFCEKELQHWQQAVGFFAAREFIIRRRYYGAILASLHYLKEKHDLANTQEIEPVEVNNDK